MGTDCNPAIPHSATAQRADPRGRGREGRSGRCGAQRGKRVCFPPPGPGRSTGRNKDRRAERQESRVHGHHLDCTGRRARRLRRLDSGRRPLRPGLFNSFKKTKNPEHRIFPAALTAACSASAATSSATTGRPFPRGRARLPGHLRPGAGGRGRTPPSTAAPAGCGASAATGRSHSRGPRRGGGGKAAASSSSRRERPAPPAGGTPGPAGSVGRTNARRGRRGGAAAERLAPGGRRARGRGRPPALPPVVTVSRSTSRRPLRAQHGGADGGSARL